ncbi:MAG: hypothetical protein GY938_05250 [Ketobacter sp.]|nr:hypothetical protein [Ketobacter sp.]
MAYSTRPGCVLSGVRCGFCGGMLSRVCAAWAGLRAAVGVGCRVRGCPARNARYGLRAGF